MWLSPSPVPLDHLMKASEMAELVEMVTIITTKNKFCLIYIHYVVIGELVFLCVENCDSGHSGFFSDGIC